MARAVVPDWQRRRDKEERERRIPLIKAWLENPNEDLTEDMWMLSHRFSEVALLVIKAFGEGFAEEFGAKTVYRRAFGLRVCPESWRIVGQTLFWLPNRSIHIDKGVLLHGFLWDIAKFKDRLLPEEVEQWGRVLVAESNWDHDLNFLGDNGIVEAIPALEARLLYTKPERPLSLREALINGREPRAMYNLLRLLAIRAARRRRRKSR